MKFNLELLTRIRFAYTLGKGLLIIAIMGGYFLVDTRIQHREQDAALLYSVAQQRMWSQRILLQTTRLAAPNNPEGITDSQTQLKEALAAMRKVHNTVRTILSDSEAIHSFSKVSALYFDGSAPLSAQLEAYLSDIERVAVQGLQQLGSAAVSVLDWLEKPIDEQRLLKAVSHAVKNGPRKGRRVLHVEDDPDIARIVATMLEGVADKDLATSLSVARERLGSGDYSLVVLDIGLPDGSGLDLLPLIHALEPPIPILVFSAQELDDDIRDQVAAAFVKSRTDESSLVRAISACLEESTIKNT